LTILEPPQASERFEEFGFVKRLSIQGGLTSTWRAGRSSAGDLFNYLNINGLGFATNPGFLLPKSNSAS
jgi:hypothetical protein